MSDEASGVQLETVHTVAESLEEQVTRLNTFRDEIQEIAEQLDQLDERELDAFYTNAETLRRDLDRKNSVSELVDLESNIRDLVRSPLREAALGKLDEFLSLIDPQLSTETRSDINEAIASCIPEDLNEITDTYGRLTPKVENMQPLLQSAIENHIQKKPSSLVNPSPELSVIVDALEQRQQSLQEVESRLSEAGSWAPHIDLVDSNHLYGNLDSQIDSARVTSQISDIDSVVSELGEAPSEEFALKMADVVERQLERELTSTDARQLSQRFRSAADELIKLQLVYERVVDQVRGLTAFGTGRGVFESDVQEQLEEFEKLQTQTFDSIEGVRRHTSRLSGDLDDFARTCSEQLRVHLNIMKSIQQELPERPPPDVGDEYASTVNSDQIQKDFDAALSALETTNRWVQEALSDLDASFDSEAVLDVWQQMNEGQSVIITDENKESVVALSDLFSLRVSLDSG